MPIRKKSKDEINSSEGSEEVLVDYDEENEEVHSTSVRKLIKKDSADQEVLNYLEKIGSTDVLDKGLTVDQYKRLKDTIKINSLGIGANIIRTCQDTCESWSRCPLAIINKAPLGHMCPVELELYEKLVIDYRDAAAHKIQGIKSMEDIEKDPVILSLISQIVEIEIMSFRANAMIATIGLTMMVPVFATEGGTEYAIQESVASRVKRELNNRRDKILRQLLATPEMVQRIKTLQKPQGISEQKRQILDRAKQVFEAEVVVENKDEADTAYDASK